MDKIMLVVENKDDQAFLEKVLERLKYQVITLKKGKDISEQLIDHFPDVVFASTLGRNARILSALGKIKEVRGKPKLVFVKAEKESGRLSSEQKDIIDGVLYSPVDPFKLIDILSNTTDISKVDLRKRYNEMLAVEREGSKKKDSSLPDYGDVKTGSQGFTKVSGKVDDPFGNTKIIGGKIKKEKVEIVSGDPDRTSHFKVEGDFKEGDEKAYWQKERDENHNPDLYQLDAQGVEKGATVVEDQEEETKAEGEIKGSKEATPEETSSSTQSSSSLINDPERAKRYKEWTDKFAASGEKPQPFDAQVLRDRQAEQSNQVQEDKTIKQNRKHFLKTLFSMDPKDIKKSS